jgi:glycerol kinase
VLLNTGPSLVHSTHGLISTVAFQLGPTAAITYALEGSVAIAGAGVAWLKDNLGIISSAREVEALARSVPDTAGVCLVPAFGGLFAPHWRDDARVCALRALPRCAGFAP